MAQTAKKLGMEKTKEHVTEGKQNGGMAVHGKKQEAAKPTEVGKVVEVEEERRADMEMEVERNGERVVEKKGGDQAAMTHAVGEAARKEEEKRQEAINEKTDAEQSKRLVVNVEIIGNDMITMMDLLRAVDNTCGRVVGCRKKGEKKWELTMSNPRGKERLLDGFKLKNSTIMASEVARDQRMVSFLNLPVYISDDQIIDKLEQWGVQAVSPIRRRKWAGTDIFDGTRFLKVRFSENVSSLPYSTKFETLEGVEYFRVIHDNQEKVCRLCMQPGHILRDCPDFKCYKCQKMGHYARECTSGQCEECHKEAEMCICAPEREEMGDTGGEEEEEEEEEEESEVEEESREEEASGAEAAVGREGRRTERESAPHHERRWSKETETNRDRSRSARRREGLRSGASLLCGQPGQGGKKDLTGQVGREEKTSGEVRQDLTEADWEREGRGNMGNIREKKQKRNEGHLYLCFFDIYVINRFI